MTHLLVGDYNTPKYRHVARSRPDVRAMDARWIAAVADLWRRDAPIDFAALEARWALRPLETCGGVGDGVDAAADGSSDESPRGSVLISITGFDLSEWTRPLNRPSPLPRSCRLPPLKPRC